MSNAAADTGLSRTDEFGLRHVIARVQAGDAVLIDAMVERIADLIADRHPDTTRDELRSMALGWLGMGIVRVTAATRAPCGKWTGAGWLERRSVF